MIRLTSSDFGAGETIPVRFTCDGDDVPPAFRWAGLPAGTRQLLLVCDDPDAPRGVFHHWVAWGFGRATPQPGFRQAINDFGRPGYAGPRPPKGDAPHGHHFRLSALDREIASAAPGATCAEVIAQARPMAIEFAELVGYYGR